MLSPFPSFPFVFYFKFFPLFLLFFSFFFFVSFHFVYNNIVIRRITRPKKKVVYGRATADVEEKRRKDRRMIIFYEREIRSRYRDRIFHLLLLEYGRTSDNRYCYCYRGLIYLYLASLSSSFQPRRSSIKRRSDSSTLI